MFPTCQGGEKVEERKMCWNDCVRKIKILLCELYFCIFAYITVFPETSVTSFHCHWIGCPVQQSLRLKQFISGLDHVTGFIAEFYCNMVCLKDTTSLLWGVTVGYFTERWICFTLINSQNKTCSIFSKVLLFTHGTKSCCLATKYKNHLFDNHSSHECGENMSSTGACDQTVNGSDTQ